MNFLVPKRKNNNSIIPKHYGNWVNLDSDNSWGLNTIAGENFPDIDLTDEDDEYILKANLPGWNQNEIELVVNDNGVILQGNHKEEKDNKKKNYMCRERYYSSFKRVFSLNETIKSTEVKATLKNGILEARIPKTESKNDKKTVPIKVE